MIIKELLRACPICQNKEHGEVLHSQNYVLTDNHVLPIEYDLVACGGCGFVYVDSPVSQHEYDKYYA